MPEPVRLAEGDGGSRQGEIVAAGAIVLKPQVATAGAVVLKPRSERRPFAFPLGRKSYLMKSTVNAELELQDTTSCV